MSKDFRELINPEKRGGKNRRRILELVAERPGISPYDVTKEVFGEPVNEKYASTRYHLDKLKVIGVLEEVGGRPHKLKLTDKGERLCESEGVKLPSGNREEFIRILNKWLLTQPLDDDQLLELKRILTEDVLDGLLSIGDDHPIRLDAKLESELEDLDPKFDVWRAIRALWIYERQKELVDHPVKKSLTAIGMLFTNTLGIKPGEMMDGIVKAKDEEIEEDLDRLLDFFEEEELLRHNPKLSKVQDIVRSFFPARVGYKGESRSKG